MHACKYWVTCCDGNSAERAHTRGQLQRLGRVVVVPGGHLHGHKMHACTCLDKPEPRDARHDRQQTRRVRRHQVLEPQRACTVSHTAAGLLRKASNSSSQEVSDSSERLVCTAIRHCRLRVAQIVHGAENRQHNGRDEEREDKGVHHGVTAEAVKHAVEVSRSSSQHDKRKENKQRNAKYKFVVNTEFNNII